MHKDLTFILFSFSLFIIILNYIDYILCASTCFKSFTKSHLCMIEYDVNVRECCNIVNPLGSLSPNNCGTVIPAESTVNHEITYVAFSVIKK